MNQLKKSMQIRNTQLEATIASMIKIHLVDAQRLHLRPPQLIVSSETGLAKVCRRKPVTGPEFLHRSLPDAFG